MWEFIATLAYWIIVTTGLLMALAYVAGMLCDYADRLEEDRITERLEADLEELLGSEIYGAPEGNDGRH